MTPKNKQSLLQHWLKGDANVKDEKALDQYGQEDDFLAEAIEGYRANIDAPHLRSITQLKARIRQKNQKNKPVIWWRIAAAIAILVVGVFGWQQLHQETFAEQAKEIQTPVLAEKMATAAKKTNPTSFIETSPSTQAVIAENGLKKQSQPAYPLRKKQSSLPVPEAAKEQVLTEKSKEETLEEKTETLSFHMSAPSTITPKTEAATISVQENAIPEGSVEEIAQMDMEVFELPEEEVIGEVTTDATAYAEDVQVFKTVSGFVKDKFGNPIDGALIFEPNNINPAAISRLDGRFSLKITPDYEALKITHETHEPLTLELKGEDYFEVNLSGKQEKTNFKKKEFRNNAPAMERAKQETVVEEVTVPPIVKAIPKGGFEKFEKYLEQNKKIPATAKSNNISGHVQVQFKVSKDGSLSDFTIRQSLGFGCDEEAIQLLKNGPKWKAEMETITIYRIEFKD